jgi:hypothetical protein
MIEIWIHAYNPLQLAEQGIFKITHFSQSDCIKARRHLSLNIPTILVTALRAFAGLGAFATVIC